MRQYIQAGYDRNNNGNLVGIEAKTGNKLWSASLFKDFEFLAIATTPVVIGNRVYASCGGSDGGGCHLFEIDKSNKAVEKFPRRNFRKFKNAYGGVVRIDGYIFGHTELSSWGCQNLDSGDIAWTNRNDLPCSSGAITAAEGKLYLYTDDGEVGLMNANPKESKLLSRFNLPRRSTFREAVGAVGSTARPGQSP